MPTVNALVASRKTGTPKSRAKTTRAKSTLGPVIARRTLTEQSDTRRKIIASIGLPRRDRLSNRDWECPFLIEGIDNSEVQLAFGVDALQALIQAIEGVRVALEKTGHNFFWLDQEQGVGIPFYVPMFQGKRFEERIRLAIEREMIRVWRGVIKRRKGEVRALVRRRDSAAGSQ